METMYALRMERSEIDEGEFTETELAILDLLEEGRGTPAYIADELDVTQEYVRSRLSDLKRLGLVRQVYRGLYELEEAEEEAE